jgi:stringent starvation protein B
MADAGDGDGDDDGKAERVQEILTSLVKQRLRGSLERVAAALVRMSDGELGPFEAHAEVLAHVSRADALAAVMSRSGGDRTPELMRAAFDAGLVAADEFATLTGVAPDTVTPPDDLDAEPSVERLPPKRAVVRRLMGEGPILVQVDARRPGVSVPERLQGDPRLVLRFGYDLTPAIGDLDIGEEALAGTLSFGGVAHRCVLPWTAVYAVVSESDQRGMVWPDDVPPEAVHTPDDKTADEAPQPRARGHLKLVD